jgi:hypothetical protein
MNKDQENRLSMYLTFNKFQEGHSSITNGLPKYSENLSQFLTTVLEIQKIWEQQIISTRGITEVKKQLKESLIVQIADYARKLGAYAKFTNNAELAEEIKISESKLMKSADTAVKSYGQIVYDLAQPLVGELAAYDITEQTQATLAKAIADYNEMIGRPGAEKVSGSQITKQLAQLFKTADAALKNMDVAVEIVRTKDPSFYGAYKGARKVIERGVGSIALRALVTDAQSGLPLKGVMVCFVRENSTNKAAGHSPSKMKLVKKTAEKGGFNIRNLAAGTYKATLKKVGYADQVITVIVNNGEMTDLRIGLEKA